MNVNDFYEGQGVVYRPDLSATPEDGVVVRTNEHYVFVLYRGDTTPKATNPEHLWPSSPRGSRPVRVPAPSRNHNRKKQ